MGKSETQSFRHGNYLEMAAFPLQETRGNVLISCRDITTHEHIMTTRNNKCLATLPCIKTEYGRKGFYYVGAKLYNDLPIIVRTAENKRDFNEKLDSFLKMK